MGIQYNSFDFHKLLQGPPGSDSRFDFVPDHLNPDAAFDERVAYVWWSHEPHVSLRFTKPRLKYTTFSLLKKIEGNLQSALEYSQDM